MICRRCDKPIMPGEKSVTVPKFSASGGGVDLHEHEECPRTPAPERRSRIPRRAR